MPDAADWKVEVVNAGDPAADYKVAIVADQLIDLTNASAGDVITVQSDGTLAPIAPAAGVTDHGALTGLGDDDHPQYAHLSQPETFTRKQTIDPSVNETALLLKPSPGGFSVLECQNVAGDTTIDVLEDGSIYGKDYESWIFEAGADPGARFAARAAGRVPLELQGAASQTADLLKLQNSAETVLARVSSDGAMYSQWWQATAGGASERYIGWTASSPNGVLEAGAAGHIPLRLKGKPSQTADLLQVVSSSDSVLFKVRGNGSLYAGDNQVTNPIFEGNPTGSGGIAFHANLGHADAIGLIVRGAGSQSADLTQWKNSAGTVLRRITSDGRMAAGGADAEAPAGFENTFNASVAGNVPLLAQGHASQTANLFEVRSGASGDLLFGVTALGRWKMTGNTAASATAGTSGDVPAQTAGYILVEIGASTYKIPFYNS